VNGRSAGGVETPCLSVVVPLYNGRDYIVDALRSLVGQTRRDFEVIVVDDGSTDDAGDLVRDFAKNSGPDRPIITLQRQANAGVSAARNRGIAATRAPYVGFLDADDLWAPDKVASHLALMMAHPSIDLSFSGYDHVDAAGHNLFEGMIPSEGILPFKTLMIRNVIHTGTVIARREAIIACRGFDPSLSHYEDFDLWLRIAATRPDNVYAIARSLASYRRHGTQTTQNWRKMDESWRRLSSALDERYPADWALVRREAYVNHRKYCASLAHNAGDVVQTRVIVADLWATAGPRILARKDGLIMTGIYLVSYLPAWLEVGMRRVVFLARKLAHGRRNRHRLRSPTDAS
jgi:glycosyltransferase involved in cell wall biosynthesis